LPKNIRCGEPFGESLSIWLEDQYKNRADLSSLPSPVKIILSSSCERIGNWDFLIQDDQIFIPNGAISAPAGRHEFLVEDASQTISPCQTKFEIVPGQPHHLECNIGSSAVFKSLELNVESRFLLENLAIRSSDIAGNICFGMESSSVVIGTQNPSVFVGSSLDSTKGRDKSNSYSAPMIDGVATFSQLFFNFSFLKSPCKVTFIIKISNVELSETCSLIFHVSQSMDRVCDLRLEPCSSPMNLAIGETFPNFKVFFIFIVFYSLLT
jgi:hypothetical protein